MLLHSALPPDCLLVSSHRDNKVATKYGGAAKRRTQPGAGAALLQAPSHYLGLVLIEAGPGPSSDQWTQSSSIATHSPHCKHAPCPGPGCAAFRAEERFNCFHLMGVVAELVV